MDPFATDAVRAAYDAVADVYADAFGDEIGRLPLDAAMLRAALDGIGRDDVVVEVGSGPAPAAEWLGPAQPWLALDLSQQMLAVARSRQPALNATRADVRRLPLRASSVGLVIARYVIQHVPRGDLPGVFAELRRVLRPGGLLLLATHLGTGHVEFTELLGRTFAPVAGAFHTRDEIAALLDGHGFEVVEQRERGPVPGEAETQRLYVVARAVDAAATRR